MVGVIAGLAIGLLQDYLGTGNDDLFKIIIGLALGLVLVAVLIHTAWTIYIIRVTKNMAQVEKYLAKAKHPYYRLLREAIQGDMNAASEILPLIKNKQLQLTTRVMLHLENKDAVAAEAEVGQIRNPVIRQYYQALIALLNKDWDQFDEIRAKFQHPTLSYVLEAERAFGQGRFQDADRNAELAISGSGGIQRYSLLKIMERQRNNLHRETYF